MRTLPYPSPKFLKFSLSAGLVITGLYCIAGLMGAAAQAQTHTPQFGVTPNNTSSSSITSNAANAASVVITAIPPRLGDDNSLKLKPGEKVQVTLRVRNASSVPITLESLADDFILDADGSTPIAVTDAVSNRWSLASWITLAPSSQVLQPNQIAQVQVVIDTPLDALPGGHYAMVTHRPVGSRGLGEQPSSSQVNQRVGTLLYAVVDGPINEEAYLRSISFPKLTEYGPVPFSFVVENVSDIHIRPQTQIEIKNFWGKSVETMSIEPKNIFPFTSRAFEGSWNRRWGIGPYTATLTMSYGSMGKVVIASSSFWLIPYTLLASAFTIIIVLLGCFIFFRQYLVRRHHAEQMRIKELEKQLHDLESPKT